MIYQTPVSVAMLNILAEEDEELIYPSFSLCVRFCVPGNGPSCFKNDSLSSKRIINGLPKDLLSLNKGICMPEEPEERILLFRRKFQTKEIGHTSENQRKNSEMNEDRNLDVLRLAIIPFGARKCCCT